MEVLAGCSGLKRFEAVQDLRCTNICERMFVLGIDPGLSRLGFGAVLRTKKGDEAVEYGVLSTPSDMDLPERLSSMNRQLRALFGRLHPQVVVVERVFFQTNARTAMGVAQASGLALAAAIDHNALVAQYTSNEVKQAIAGFGAADKGQMQRMVQRILRLDEVPKPADAADALGLALHHLALAAYSSSAKRSGQLEPTRTPIASHAFGNARVATSLGGVRIRQDSPEPDSRLPSRSKPTAASAIRPGDSKKVS